MTNEFAEMNQKEQTISKLVFGIAGAGFLLGIALGAFVALRSGGATEIVSSIEGLFLMMAFVLPVALVFTTAKDWPSWQAMLRVEAAETVGLMVGIAAFGSSLAMAVFMLPVAAFAYLLHRVGPWELLPNIYESLVWREFGIVLLATTATAALLATYLYQSTRE